MERRRCVRRPARLSTRWFPRRWRRRVRGRWRTALREEESGSDRGERNEASAYRVRERGRDATQAWRCCSLAQEQHTYMSGVAALASTPRSIAQEQHHHPYRTLLRTGAAPRGSAPRGPRGRGPPLGGGEGDAFGGPRGFPRGPRAAPRGGFPGGGADELEDGGAPR